MCLENVSISIHDLLKFTISQIDKLSSYSLVLKLDFTKLLCIF